MLDIINNTIKGVGSLLLLGLFIIGCGGGSDATTEKAPTELNDIEKRVTSNPLDATGQASMAATTADIEAKLRAQAFSNGSANGAPARAGSTANDYHLADVIFTIGTDDLGDTAPNTLEKNAAYNYFKTYVADAGKLSADELAEFNSASIEEFNEAFVSSYYEAAEDKLGTDVAAASGYATPLPLLSYGAVTTAKTPKRFFGFFFKIFNPMTYMGFMMNMVKAVMTWALAQMFKMMLMSGTMTKLMLRLSLAFPILTSIMIHVLGQYWGITARMVPYLKYDREFGELFMQLAYEQPKMAHFVFQNIDAPLYNAMTYAMLLSQETTERLSIMMNWYALAYLKTPSQGNRYDAFTNQLFFTRDNVVMDSNGTTTGHGDGLELANERFYYAMFSYPLSTAQFIRAMEHVDANEDHDAYNPHGTSGHQTVIDFMDFIFLGVQDTDIYGDKTGLNADRMQGSFNIFAIAQGMLKGIERAGFETYLQNFIDFAYLIPPERYLDYGQAFGMAGYTYFNQAIYPGLSTYVEGQDATMSDFILYLMGDGTATNPGVVGPLLGAAMETHPDEVQMFQGMLEGVQPYINEFMQNGMPNMSMPNLSDSNASVIINGDVNQTITTPLEQQATVIPNPTSLLDVINNFPVLWEKDYSDEGFKGDRTSNDPYGYRWSEMPEALANLNWMQIPYPNNFTQSSYFDFIFQNGTVDMYVLVKTSNDYMMTGAFGSLQKYSDFGMSAVTPTPVVKAVNQYGQGVSFKVYKLTVAPEDKLYMYELIKFNLAAGIAFDLSAAVPQDILPTGINAEEEPLGVEEPTVEPVEPPVETEVPNTLKPEDPDVEEDVVIPEPEVVVDNTPEETGQPVVEPEPEIVSEPEPEPEPQPEPTVYTLSDVIQNLPSGWEKDYSGENYKSQNVTNEYDEKWLSMSSFMSSLNWIEIPQYTNFSYTDTMHFNYATTIYFITQNNSKSSFEFTIDQQGNLEDVTETITSDDSWDTFYVYKLAVPAGYDLGSLNWIESRTSGLAFDISALNN